MDPRGLRVTQTTYFSLLTHAKQLLLVTLSHTPAGIGNLEVGRDGTGRTMDAAVRTDRRECQNSYVDEAHCLRPHGHPDLLIKLGFKTELFDKCSYTKRPIKHATV